MERAANDFWSKVDIRSAEECWRFGSAVSYGHYAGIRASRVALLLSGVEVPEGMVVMHTCDNPPCVNPNHLKVSTQAENLKDARDKGRHRGNNYHLKTECKRGHPFSQENTLLDKKGRRRCKTCVRQLKRNYVQRQKDFIAAEIQRLRRR